MYRKAILMWHYINIISIFILSFSSCDYEVNSLGNIEEGQQNSLLKNYELKSDRSTNGLEHYNTLKISGEVNSNLKNELLNTQNIQINPSIQYSTSLPTDPDLDFMQFLKWDKSLNQAFNEMKELCENRKSLQNHSWSKYNLDYSEGKKSLEKLGLATGVDINIDKYTPINFVDNMRSFFYKINTIYKDYLNGEISKKEFLENITEFDSVLNSAISMLYVLNTYRSNEARRYVEDDKFSPKKRLSIKSASIILETIFNFLDACPAMSIAIAKSSNLKIDDAFLQLEAEDYNFVDNHSVNKLSGQEKILKNFDKVFGTPQNLSSSKKYDWNNYIIENQVSPNSALATLIKNDDLRDGKWCSSLPPFLRISNYNKKIDVLIKNISGVVPIFNNIIDKIMDAVNRSREKIGSTNNIEELGKFINEVRAVIKNAKENEDYKNIDNSIDSWLADMKTILLHETFADLGESERNGPTKGLAYAGKWIPDKKDKQLTKGKWEQCMQIISSITAIRVFLESNGTMNIPFNVLSADIPDQLYETISQQKARVDESRSQRYANILYSLFLLQTIPNIIPGVRTVATLAAIGFASLNWVNNKNKIHIIKHKVKEYFGYF